jgi:nitrite reductase (NADH) small subunit
MKYDVGGVDEFPEGSCRILTVGNRSVGVYNVGGSFHAVLNYCPHHGAPVCLGKLSGTMLPSSPGEYEYGLDGSVLRCPWHGWEFDLASGRCLFGVDRARLKTYPISLEDGRIVIDAKAL